MGRTSWRSAGAREDPMRFDTESNDLAETLLATAEQLFATSQQLEASGRHAEATTILRVALDGAIRGELIATTGKHTCLCPAEKIAATMRAVGAHDRKFHQIVAGAIAGQLSKAAQRRILARYCHLQPDEPGRPRQLDEAHQLYRAVTPPEPQCRSVFRPSSCRQAAGEKGGVS
jgi:hypothetical protein